VTLGQITKKKFKTILHTVLKFQFNCACFHGGDANSDFDVSNSVVFVWQAELTLIRK